MLRPFGPGLILFPAVQILRHRERSAEVAAELTRLSRAAAVPGALAWSRVQRTGDAGDAGSVSGTYGGDPASFLSTTWRLVVKKEREKGSWQQRNATVTLQTFGASAGNAWAWDVASARRNEAFCSSALMSPGDSPLAVELCAIPGFSYALVRHRYMLYSMSFRDHLLHLTLSPRHRSQWPTALGFKPGRGASCGRDWPSSWDNHLPNPVCLKTTCHARVESNDDKIMP